MSPVSRERLPRAGSYRDEVELPSEPLFSAVFGVVEATQRLRAPRCEERADQETPVNRFETQATEVRATGVLVDGAPPAPPVSRLPKVRFYDKANGLIFENWLTPNEIATLKDVTTRRRITCGWVYLVDELP